jgi:hypothetical protein
LTVSKKDRLREHRQEKARKRLRQKLLREYRLEKTRREQGC